MNKDLDNIHALLVAQHEALYQKLDTAPDADTMDAILTEMREIRHRMDLVQNLLFRQATQQLTDAVKRVTDADAQLTTALSSAQTAAAVVKSVSSFLYLVDRAIDLAKTLALA